MVDITAPLKSHQVEVLRWVGAGCPEAEMPGEGAKLTARALQGRRLVMVSRRSGRWSAALTERGRYYLGNGRYPEPTDAASSAPWEGPATPAAPEGRGRRPTAQSALIQEATVLIERLQTSGGTVVVPGPDADSRASYRRAIHAAKQHKLVPDGYDLRHTGRNTGDLVICLYSAAQPYDTDWNRLRLGQGDDRATASADYSALEQDPTNLRVAPESVPRVLAVLKAINDAGSAGRCRVGINLTTKAPKPYVKFGSTRRSLDFIEEYDQVPHVLTVEERRTKRLRPWAHIPEFDSVPTGRLRLEVSKYQSDRRLTWRDTPTRSLEQQASRIVAGIIKAVEEQQQVAAAFRKREQERQAATRLAEHRASEERRRRDAERRTRWEHAITNARRLAIEEHRRTTFNTAMKQWQKAVNMREFCNALEHAAADQTAYRGELNAWLAWARARADNIDPTVGTPALATINFAMEPSTEDLRPHLDGWSPHNPVKE
ncbi:hypothetical protein Acy02nite_47100 [Actinoplanes cyaneus]|uniref:PE-PGRS family protein n=1 Tax=Actinoplanes cyaneus TaxID=52696 RepID=A0A919M8U3_9ACTN|nr:hypothetical protein [Actinoplanes cyaneus]MCW2138835.1 hypothetical protein [Actinoplanes cyaneus]GID66829.1 hypothetical protein Acy02nite_47100 [Actinoplanes cyaneus]